MDWSIHLPRSVAILLVVIVANSFWYMLSSVLAATNQHRRLAVVYLSFGSAALLASVPLSSMFGLEGAATALLVMDIPLIAYVFPASLRVVHDSPGPFVRALLDVRGVLGMALSRVRPLRDQGAWYAAETSTRSCRAERSQVRRRHGSHRQSVILECPRAPADPSLRSGISPVGAGHHRRAAGPPRDRPRPCLRGRFSPSAGRCIHGSRSVCAPSVQGSNGSASRRAIRRVGGESHGRLRHPRLLVLVLASDHEARPRAWRVRRPEPGIHSHPAPEASSC